MTDKEIIKALECCKKLTHNGWGENQKICEEECPYKANCYDEEKIINMISDTLDLINRQQAEIERLKNRVFCKVVVDEEKMRSIINEKMLEYELDVEAIKSEAIKEFAEKLKDDSWFTDLYDRDEYPVRAVTIEDIDNLVKEMVGEQE